MHYDTPTRLVSEVTRLVQSWHPRMASVQRWYNLIRLQDDLAQVNMESVISNDPRTGFNMAAWLLTPRTSSFRVTREILTEIEAGAAGQLETLANRELLRAMLTSRGLLFGDPITRLVQFMLATGWYSMASLPTPEGWVMSVWNPMSVFPHYDSNGHLVKVARRYTVSAEEARTKVSAEGWAHPPTWWQRNVSINSLWWEEDGGVYHAVVIGGHWAKPPTALPLLRIPVFTGPVAGLPDDGTITDDYQWRSDVGQSVVTPVAQVVKNYDKMLTYVQQILRDTANPKYVERVRRSVLDPDKVFQRGAIFTISPDESIDALQPPALPAELRTHEFDLRSMVQRGLFPDATFGGITGQISSLLLSQVVAVAKQTLNPFKTRLSDVLGEAATFNVRQSLVWQRSGLHDFHLPTWAEKAYLSFLYDITVPGDFIQRASTARVLNPDFRLSTTSLLEVLFPEVQSAIVEQGRLQAEDATRNPIFRSVMAVGELQRAAREARQLNDEEFATRLERAAQLMEAQMFGPPEAGQPPSADGLAGMRPEGLPPTIQQLLSPGM